MNTVSYMQRIIKNIIFSFLCYLLLFISTVAQTQKPLNSRQLLKLKDDSNKVKLLLNHARNFGLNAADSNLFYAQKALDIAKIIHYENGIFYANFEISSACYINGNYSLGLKTAKNAMALAKKINNKFWLQITNNSIGLLYQQMKKYKESIYYFNEALLFCDSIKQPSRYSSLANNLSNSYMYLNQPEKSLEFRRIAMRIRTRENDRSSLADSYNDLGEFYIMHNRIDTAIYFFKKSYNIKDSVKDMEMTALTSLNLGVSFLSKKDLNKAKLYLNKCLSLSNKINAPYYALDATSNLAKIAGLENNTKHENTFLKQLLTIKDTLYNIENQKQLNRLYTEFETEKKELEIKNLKIKQEAEQKHNKLILMFFIIGTFSIFLFLLFVANRYRIIRAQKRQIEAQKKTVEDKNKEIIDSINYASIIQKTLITAEKNIEEYLLTTCGFKDMFIFFMPKDVVSGDFYWATMNDNGVFLAVCDSTGHGVPGAFMSLLNINLLNEAINVRNIEKTNEIFSFIRSQLIQNLSYAEDKKDGMDGCLFYFSKNQPQHIQFASAFNAPVLIRNREIIELPCDRKPIGFSEHDHSFNLYAQDALPNDWIYSFSDGFADQFGGKENKRFKRKAFHELLAKLSPLNGKEQKEQLLIFLNEWKGKQEQVDDILVVGIKL
jgi:serine phosphatase RsbU (regulator of sigma subunit)